MDWSGTEGTWWRLRTATWADESAIAAHGRGPDPLWIGIGPSAPPERAREVLGEFLKGANGAFGATWLVVAKQTDQIAGVISGQNHGPSTVEIVYGVAPAWRGRGLATEMSMRVAEKSGYRFLGIRRSVVGGTGQFYDDLVYVPSWCAERLSVEPQ